MKSVSRLHGRGTLLNSASANSPIVRPPVSRRRFLRTSAGALAVGATFGRQLLRPMVAQAAGTDPIPVAGSPNLAPFNVWAPIFVDSIDAEPATITNFNGNVGIAYLSGSVTRTNRVTGEVDTLPFLDADMRFMQGVYRGVDGKPRQGTFGFV
jgi:hypothetical protein